MGKKLVLKEMPAVSKDTADFLLLFLGLAALGYALYIGGVFNGRDAKIIEFPTRKNSGNADATAKNPGNGDETK